MLQQCYKHLIILIIQFINNFYITFNYIIYKLQYVFYCVPSTERFKGSYYVGEQYFKIVNFILYVFLICHIRDNPY